MNTRKFLTIGTIVGLASITILLYIAYLSHQEFEKTLVFQIQQQQLTVARTTAYRLKELTGHLSRHLEVLANEFLVQEEIYNRTLSRKPQACPLKNFYEGHEAYIDALLTCDINGVILCRYPFWEDAKDRVGTSLAGKPGVAYVLREHKPYVSEWFYNNLGQPAISITQPVSYKDKFVGLVRCMISLDTLSEHFIQPIERVKGSQAWILDEKGTLLGHSDIKQQGKNILALRKKEIPDHDWSALERIVEYARQGQEGVGMYDCPKCGKRLIAYAPVQVGNHLWSIGVSTDYFLIAGPLYRHAVKQITIAGLVMLLFLAGGFTFYRVEKKNAAELGRRNEELKQEISERKRAEGALRESEEKLAGIVDSVTDHMSMVDDQFNIVWTNNVARKWFGPDLVGQKCYAAYRGRNKVCETCIVKKCFEDGRTRESETEIVGADGKQRAFWSTASVAARYEDGRPKMVVEFLCDVTDRKQAEKQIKTSLKEKEILLKEIHHRVKNNLQVISSLLKLQSQYVKDKKDAEIFKESQNQIRSIAYVHEKLYQSEDLAKINFYGYVKHLVNALFRSYGIDTGRIVLKTDIDDVMIGIDTAIPCALIINELVSNSLKYAFPGGRKGEVEIGLHTLNENEIELTVGDNGIGIPEDLDYQNSKSLGLKLVSILTNQIQGKLKLDRGKGTKFRITFKVTRYGKRA